MTRTDPVAEAPDLAALQASIDEHLTVLWQAVTTLQGACWGPDDEPLAALPDEWFRRTTHDLNACVAALKSTPTAEAVECQGDYSLLA